MAKRNYRYFIGFIFALTFHIFYVFFWSGFYLIREAVDHSLANSLADNPIAAVELVVSFVFGWCLCSLSMYHVYLISENKTTNEDIKLGNRPGNEAPSFCTSCYDLFCSPMPESLINLRAPVSLAYARDMSAGGAGRSSRPASAVHPVASSPHNGNVALAQPPPAQGSHYYAPQRDHSVEVDSE